MNLSHGLVHKGSASFTAHQNARSRTNNTQISMSVCVGNTSRCKSDIILICPAAAEPNLEPLKTRTAGRFLPSVALPIFPSVAPSEWWVAGFPRPPIARGRPASNPGFRLPRVRCERTQMHAVFPSKHFRHRSAGE